MLKKDRRIIHVEVKATGEHRYYGSAAALFDDPEMRQLIRISYQSFRKKSFSETSPYENDSVVVHKGSILTICHKE